MTRAYFPQQQISQIVTTHTHRFDIYAIIHKALRKYMFETLTMVGSVDGNDEQELLGALAQVRELLAFCKSHLEHESEFIHRAMEARQPGSTAAVAEDHEHHEWAIGRLSGLADAVEQADAGTVATAISQLYRYLALFVAENLTHMNAEETEHNAVLWATHSDDELISLEQALVASIRPQESALAMRWMIPAMNATEREHKLAGIRRHAPAPVFEAVLGIAQANLSGRDWQKLAGALALPGTLAA